jgi:hypothetical protein
MKLIHQDSCALIMFSSSTYLSAYCVGQLTYLSVYLTYCTRLSPRLRTTELVTSASNWSARASKLNFLFCPCDDLSCHAYACEQRTLHLRVQVTTSSKQSQRYILNDNVDASPPGHTDPLVGQLSSAPHGIHMATCVLTRRWRRSC